FDLETLALVYEKPLGVTFTDLSPAIRESLIIPSNQEYSFYHDRIQEAAYSLISEQEKKGTHYRIGSLILAKTRPDALPDKIFYVVDQLNAGADLIQNTTEKIKLAELNLTAGKKAKASTAYASAAQYLTKGINFLSSGCWQDQYQLTLDLYFECSECRYLSGNFEEAEKLFDIILNNAKTNLEKAKVYRIWAALCQNRGNPHEALKNGRKGLKLLGVTIPDNPKNISVFIEIGKAKWFSRRLGIADLTNLPRLDDPVKQTIMEILFVLGPAAYYCNKKVFTLVMLHIFIISIRHGTTNAAFIGYITYGFIISVLLDEYRAGYEFAKSGIYLSNQGNNLSIKSMCDFLIGGFVNHWTHHIKKSIQYLIEGHVCGLESGNLTLSGYNAGVHAVMKFFKGDDLNDLQTQSEKYLEFFKRSRIKDMHLAITSVHRMTLCLKGLTKGYCSFDDDSFNEVDFVKIMQPQELIFILCLYYIFKLPLFYLFNELPNALEASKILQKNTNYMVGMFYIPHHNFYYSLTLAALHPSAGIKTRHAYWKQLNKNQKKMKMWADNCPENFLNKYSLIAAEMAYLKGNNRDAEQLYNRAINTARESEFIHEEALAHELAAKFHKKNQNEKSASCHMQEARSCYHKWGATAKVAYLEKTYPQYFNSSALS
ncbi:MAG: hypothetical protein WC539_05635, partial [Nitrospirota bacterium]